MRREGRMPVAAQMPLYHPALAGTPPEEGNWNHLGGLFPTPLYYGSTELTEDRTAELDERLASKSVTDITDFGDTSLCRAESLIQSEIPKPPHSWRA